MAKPRAPLSFDQVKASKPTPAAAEPAPVAQPEPQEEKRGRGRPAKRPADERVFGMTLRVPGALRRALRRLAEEETDDTGRIVSVHDVILEAVTAHLARKGVKVGD